MPSRDVDSRLPLRLALYSDPSMTELVVDPTSSSIQYRSFWYFERDSDGTIIFLEEGPWR